MIRNKFNQFRVTMTIALAIGIAISEAAARDQNRPNILMIIVDDLNDWVGVMNAHPNAHTPNIDRLAEKGTLFTNAHAAAPLCGPTRAALLSGLRPSTTGIYGHNNYRTLTASPHLDEEYLLPRYLSRHGYKTLSTGKVFHEGSPPEAFDEVGLERRDFGPRPDHRLAYTPPEGQGTLTDWGVYPERDEQMPDYVIAQWASEQLQKDHDQPFFMSVGFIRPHVPWYVPQEWFDTHPLDQIVLPHHTERQFDDLPETALCFSELPQMPDMQWMLQEKRWEKSVQAYLASVTFVDHYVGVVLDALEASDHADNTIIVFFSDHGYHLGTKGIWAKHTLWEESTRIPMIIRRPGDTGPGHTHKPANHMDIYPTLLELAGIPPRPENEGVSLVPLLDDPEADGFHASVTTHAYGNHSVRTERWRYIRYEDGSEELYDHWSDSNEWNNLAGVVHFADIIEKLAKYLPDHDEPLDANTRGGVMYNDYFRNLFERTGNDR